MNIDINDLPETVTVYIYPLLSSYGNVMVHTNTIDGYTQIGEPVSVTFKTRSKDVIVSDVVANLKEESSKIRAKAEVECNRINDKINSLLAIEDKS